MHLKSFRQRVLPWARCISESRVLAKQHLYLNTLLSTSKNTPTDRYWFLIVKAQMLTRFWVSSERIQTGKSFLNGWCMTIWEIQNGLFRYRNFLTYTERVLTNRRTE